MLAHGGVDFVYVNTYNRIKCGEIVRFLRPRNAVCLAGLAHRQPARRCGRGDVGCDGEARRQWVCGLNAADCGRHAGERTNTRTRARTYRAMRVKERERDVCEREREREREREACASERGREKRDVCELKGKRKRDVCE